MSAAAQEALLAGLHEPSRLRNSSFSDRKWKGWSQQPSPSRAAHSPDASAPLDIHHPIEANDPASMCLPGWQCAVFLLASPVLLNMKWASLSAPGTKTQPVSPVSTSSWKHRSSAASFLMIDAHSVRVSRWNGPWGMQHPQPRPTHQRLNCRLFHDAGDC